MTDQQRFTRLVLGLAALSAAVTVLGAVGPVSRLDYRNTAAQAAFETAAALIAILAASLLLGRVRRTRTRSDLLLAAGLAVLAFTNLAFGAVATALGNGADDWIVWAQALCTLAGAAAMAQAGRAARQPPVRTAPGGMVLAGGCAAASALIGAAALGLAAVVDPRVHVDVPPEDVALLDAHPLLLASQFLTAALFALAAAGALRGLRRRSDELVGWVAAGATLAAGARLCYALIPSSTTGWLATGDILRFGFYALLLVGGAREIASYQRRLVSAAVSEERRRIARDVHDGLAQDLAFISSRTRALEAGDVAAVREAAARAMDESRALLAALSDDGPPPAVALERAARQAAALAGIELRSTVDPALELPPATTECLRRIAVESIRNAARHGRAELVRLSLGATDGAVRLLVSDDGDGFDLEHGGENGFGLTSMRERAEAAGGSLRVRSRAGEGTTVEVRV
jgi:signal transduction histidine kinase